MGGVSGGGYWGRGWGGGLHGRTFPPRPRPRMRKVTEVDMRKEPVKSNVFMASRTDCFCLPWRPRSSGTVMMARTRHMRMKGSLWCFVSDMSWVNSPGSSSLYPDMEL